MSVETRQKIAEAATGRVPWNKGKTGIYSKETKAKMGAKNLGKALSKTHKANISKGLKEFYKDHEGVNKGKSRTQEANERTSRSLQQNRKDRIQTTLEEAKILCQNLGLTFKEATSRDGLVSQLEAIKVICKCGNEYGTRLNYLKYGAHQRCKSCSSGYSQPEKDLVAFIKELGIEEVLTNKRPEFLDRKELDLWIPDKGVAIEFHGLVHHSERSVFYDKDLNEVKYQHETKYLKCKNNGIKLIQIFEDEWAEKPEIVKSMIAARLGKSTTIAARKTILRKLKREELRIFFNENHISGAAQAITGMGLFYEDELVCAISLRKTWNKRYGENVLEIARFATLKGFTVVGGFSKLMKEVKVWAKTFKYDSILTYADCRFGSGEVYKNYGFEHLGKTRPNYYYEKNGKREDRFSHRKNNNPEIIKQFGNTEREQNNNQGWYAIYDAGSEIYLLNLLDL